MKKYLLPLFALLYYNLATAQFITTNPATTPVTLGADLNLGVGKLIRFNTTPIIKYFGGAVVNNIGFGANSGNNATTGQFNVLIGQNTAGISPSGDNNVYIGANAGYQATGNLNFGIGGSALASNTGSNNLGIGATAGTNNTGDLNSFLGYLSGRNNHGNKNTFIGIIASNDLGITGSDNLFIGNNTKTANLAVTRATALGFQATVDINDGIVLGDPAIAAVKVGVGTASPAAKLHIVGGGTAATGVRFQGLPTDAVAGLATQYVVIDVDGNLYRYTGTAPARIGAPEGTTVGFPSSFNENWTLKNDFLYNKNKKGIIIGEGISVLPKGYGMYVTDGILTEKVKVAIKNSSDWADYVFNKDYKKMTLTEVEKFIKVNKHLPNMLSATEMVTEGNDLAKTDAKLLEKIEELTLYMIEMKKDNTQMKRQINSLKRKLNK